MKIKYLLILVSAVLLVGGCINEELGVPGRTTLKARLEATGTKVSIDDFNGKLTWIEGDEIAVHVGNAYQNVAVDPATEELSIAETETSYRNYYAVYPASVAVAGDYGNPDLKVTLPASYDISDIVDGSSTTKDEDFAPLPMVANNDHDNSILYFYHVGGLLRVTLNGVKPATKFVRITFDKDVTGSYTVADPGTDHPTITTAGNETNNAVTFTLTGETQLGPTLAAGTIVLNVPVPCGSYDWVKVECLNSSNTAIASKTYDEKTRTFQRHHGKRLSDDDLVFDFVLGTLPDAASEGLSDVTVAYTGGDGSFATSFVSYKTSDGGETKTAVPFTLEYSEDGGKTWSTNAPSWLSSAPAGGVHAGGTTGESMAVTVSPQVNSAVDEHHVELCKTSRAKTGFDLSLVDVSTFSWTGGTSGSARRTANCYVVQGSGTYKFPLVYGNGVDWTKNGTTGINESAFRAKAGVDATTYRLDDGEIAYSGNWYLGSFKDHLDGNIYNGGDAQSSPYLTTHLNKNASDFTAVLLWQDAPGLVTVNPTISVEDGIAFLTFSVPVETITQGNALVAVLVDADGDSTPEIAWSWHVWVTEEDLTAVKVGSNGNYFAPVDIGWCEGKAETYAARTCQVRATQAGSGLARTATLTQTAGRVVPGGNSPYYQWGRKDPLQASNGKIAPETTFKTYYPSESAYAPAIVTGPVSIGAAIRSPYTFYTNNNDWCSTIYYNSWSSTIQTFGMNPDTANAKTKTVYDPSPVGFRVPALDAWSEFTRSNFTWCRPNVDHGIYDYGRTYTPTVGLFFPASGSRFNNGGLRYVGDNAHHWSSSAYSMLYGYNLFFTNGMVTPEEKTFLRAGGAPVRCVTDRD